MTKKELLEKKEQLESQNSRLRGELAELDHLMRLAGFSNGLETVKATAQELARYHDEADFPSDDYA